VHVGATINVKSDNTSKAASSAKKENLSDVHDEATNGESLKSMLVHFEKIIRVIICCWS
jgi:hypothetical protein